MSNTFIRDQMTSYQTWQPLSFGVVRLSNRLTDPDGYVFREGRNIDRIRRRIPGPGLDLLTYQAARHLRPKIVHAHFGTDALAAQPVAHRLGVPLVVTFHGYDITALRDRPEYVPQLRRLIQSTDLLVAVSGHIEQRLYDLGADRRRVLLHYTGVPIPTRTADAATRRGVLFIGRLVEKKGVADLISAYSSLPADIRARHPLTVVGDGPLMNELKRLDTEVQAATIFTGNVPSSQVASFLDRAAVAAVPSRTAADGDTEGLPTVILEAAARGVPVIASMHAGNSEAIDDGLTGLLFAEGKTHSLTEQLAWALTHETELAAMGSGARALAVERFDIAKQTPLLEQAYDDLM